MPQGAKVCGSYDSQIAVGQKQNLDGLESHHIFPMAALWLSTECREPIRRDMLDSTRKWITIISRFFSAAAMLSIISAGVQLSQPQQASTNGVPNTNQTVAAALGQQLGQVSTSMIQRDLKIQPTLTQMPGYRFNIQITRDIVFKGPYKA
ncbi:TrbI/VirB10 family protein [Undibacterium arcticum]